MPKASMNKDNCTIRRQYNIRGSWQIASMQPEAIAERVQQLPNYDFRRSVL